MTPAAWMLTFAMFGGSSPALTERVDAIEVNQFFDDNGRCVFTQDIFYQWENGRYEIVAWRLVKDETLIPQRDRQRGGYTVLWWDKDVLREVRAESVQESWTQVDVELVQREWLPKERRRGLRGESCKTH